MNLRSVKRNQLMIAALCSLLLTILWWFGDLTHFMDYALSGVILSLWVPAIMVHKQSDNSLAWNVLFGVLGITAVSVVVRAAWLIGRV